MCDIDFFKQYNDTYGHIMGDECIIKVAECLIDSFKRASDFSARYGGEEFSVILPHTESNEAIKLSNSFLENLKKIAIPHSSSSISEYVSISSGLVSVVPDEESDANLIIKAADNALYKAKGNGRNRIEVAAIE